MLAVRLIHKAVLFYTHDVLASNSTLLVVVPHYFWVSFCAGWSSLLAHIHTAQCIGQFSFQLSYFDPYEKFKRCSLTDQRY